MNAVQSQPAPAPRFTKVSSEGLLLPSDATDWVAVYDAAQALTWTRRSLPGGVRTWKKAKAASEALTLCGWHGQWRLATRLEWAHLIDDSRVGPAIDPDFFTVEKNEYWCWTGTECAPSGCAWVVYLNGGNSGRYDVGDRLRVRAVRAGQSFGLSV